MRNPNLRACRPSGRLSPLLLLLLVSACSTPVTPGDASLTTGGASPETLASPESNPSGMLEVARVRLAGQSLSTRLFGQTDATPQDGAILVVSSASFAWPPDYAIRSAYAAIPQGPTLPVGENLRCQLELGPQILPWNIPGIHVDVGPRVLVTGGLGAIGIRLDRTPSQRGIGFARTMRYQSVEPARVSSEGYSPVNWSGGSTVAIAFPGAPLPEAREYGALPATLSAGSSLTLPRALTEGSATTLELVVGGVALELPARDPLTGAVLSQAPRPVLPEGGAGLEVLWPVPDTPQRVVLSLELLGTGTGSCPGECGSSASCCQTNTSCPSGHLCQSVGDLQPACYPEEGDVAARLGALVCTAVDSGQTTLPGSSIADLLSRFPQDTVKGAILRFGRVNSVESTLADAIASDGTRHALDPVLMRAADVVITRLTLPSSKEGGQ